DRTGHKPYFLTNMSPEELWEKPAFSQIDGKIVDMLDVSLKNLIRDKEARMTKIVTNNPLDVRSLRNFVPKAWEAHIKYYLNYIYDLGIVPGHFVKIEGDRVSRLDFGEKDVLEEFVFLFKEKGLESRYKDLVEEYMPLFISPIPDIKRVAIDIEVYASVEGRMPDPTDVEEEVIAASIVDNRGRNEVILLDREGKVSEKEQKNFIITSVDTEKKLIEELFKVLDSYPVVLTFNGDNFDLKYLYNRAIKLKIPKEKVPIILGKNAASLRNGVHVDLYRFFINHSIKDSAFGGRYKEGTLDAVAKALVGEGKLEIEDFVSKLGSYELAHYCWRDSDITLRLTTFDSDLVMKLIVLLMRISRLPIEDVTRFGVSIWIKNLFYHEHRRKNYLIPRYEDIKEKGSAVTKAIIKDKKYKGAIVVEPEEGIHFNVKVLDFSSLYPSIIKTHNLSYETVNCPHPECGNKKVPDTTHWVCEKNDGIMSLIIGFLRDIRVFWFKPRSKDKGLTQAQRELYSVVERSVKVFVNASYGVLGAETFPLYCPPVAESTTAIGRYAITQTIKRAEEIGIKVLYGDTDSLFIKNPTTEQINGLIKWCHRELGLDLEVDKVYRYVALSARKKNYLGVHEDGIVDVKGLMGKKRNTPKFLREIFYIMLEELGKVTSIEEFEEAKEKIREIVRKCYRKLENGEYSYEDLSFTVQLSKAPAEYVKTTPQHVKAARLLEQKGRTIKRGDIINFVKVRGSQAVVPISQASKYEIDVPKYKEHI
ncbi:MAG: DNA-directed DNA polymerase I, partial [Asgard group archaeon]